MKKIIYWFCSLNRPRNKDTPVAKSSLSTKIVSFKNYPPPKKLFPNHFRGQRIPG